MPSSPSIKTKQEPSVSAEKVRGLAWFVSPRLWIREIIGLDDTPRAIALGAAIGTFVAFTPTVGIQMLVVLAIGWVFKPFFRFNKLAGLIAVYISNPVTTLPIYWFNYWVGSFFISGTLTKEKLASALNYESFSQWGHSLWMLMIEIGGPLVLGSIIVGLCCALPTYPFVKWLVVTLQEKKRQRALKNSSEH